MKRCIMGYMKFPPLVRHDLNSVDIILLFFSKVFLYHLQILKKEDVNEKK